MHTPRRIIETANPASQIIVKFVLHSEARLPSCSRTVARWHPTQITMKASISSQSMIVPQIYQGMSAEELRLQLEVLTYHS